jgi:predicted O-methyltransferase YrrM
MTRNDLPSLIKDDGIALELGVAAGHYSEVILKNSKARLLYSIDRWADHHDQKEQLKCTKKLSAYGKRSHIMWGNFEDCIDIFDNDTFDFIYIDAYASDGQQNGKLLYDWFPKLKKGGIFSGHDYHTDFPKTIKAVDRFCKEFDYKPNIIDGHISDGNQQKYNSWYIIK